MIPSQGMDGAPRGSDYPCITNGIDISSIIEKDPVPEKYDDDTDEDEDPRNFSLPIYKKIKIRIYKPLILLKLSLFLWYGAGAPMSTFLIVFFKQRGLTLSELSTVYALIPVGQFIGPVICGIIADKIGRPKPVLIVNLLLNAVIGISILASPSLNFVNCDPQPLSLKCHLKEYGRLIAKASCDVNADVIELSSCSATCPENATQYCNGQNLICDMLAGNEDFDNFSLSVHVNWAYKSKSKCYYNVTSMSHKNTTYSWCNIPHKMFCKIYCSMNTNEDCSADNSGRKWILILNIVLLILFFSVFSITYIFFDVTAMALVKEHNSDFGRERFFALAGIVVFSPLSGYLIGATKSDEGDIYNDTAFYFFFCMIFVLFIILYKLRVQIRPPGKNMWRKSFSLLKNPDVVPFAAILIVLGTAWGFTKKYISLYLEQMKDPRFLLGLLTAINALYGLPFLVTSNWWVEKIGTTQIFLLGLLGYVVSGIGYSLLYDPWLSLLIEVTSIVTYHLLWVAVIVHSYSLAPEGLTATIISLAGALHFSIGKGTGQLFGGLTMDAYGEKVSFRIMAGSCLIAALLYAIYLYIRKTCTINATTDVKNAVECQEENELKTI